MSRTLTLLTLICLTFLSAETAFAWDPVGGGDHGESAYAPGNGSEIAGRHYGITTFSIPSTSTVSVETKANGWGWVSIHAQTIDIQGKLNGNYAGYQGGSGGLGGGSQQGGKSGGWGGSHVSGAEAQGALHGNPGNTKDDYHCGTCCSNEGDKWLCGGGGGGSGGGGGYIEPGCKSSYGGESGASNHCVGGAAGGSANGGYTMGTVVWGGAWIENGVIPSDSTQDMTGYVYMGSGGGGSGGGGGGGNASGAQGDSGGAGGAQIVLWASGNYSQSGTIYSKGQYGANGGNRGSSSSSCSDCGCGWFDDCGEKCAYYTRGGYGEGAGGGSGGGVSVGGAGTTTITGEIAIGGGLGGDYYQWVGHYGGKGSGGVVRIHNASPSCTSNCEEVATGATCSGATLEAEIWNGTKRSNPSPQTVNILAENIDIPGTYKKLKIKFDGHENILDEASGADVTMAYGQVYQLYTDLYQTEIGGAGHEYKFLYWIFPDTAKYYSTNTAIFYNGGNNIIGMYKDISYLYWTGKSADYASDPSYSCTGDNANWSNPCNWVNGDNDVLAVAPGVSDDVVFKNHLAWGYYPEIDGDQAAQSVLIEPEAVLDWSAAGGSLSISTTLTINGGTLKAPDGTTATLSIGTHLYLNQSPGSSRGYLYFDNTSLEIKGDLIIGPNTEFDSGALGVLTFPPSALPSTISNFANKTTIDTLNIDKGAGQEAILASDIGNVVAGTGDTINSLEVSSGTLKLATFKLGVRDQLLVSSTGKVFGDNINSELIIRGHKTSVSPLQLEDTGIIEMSYGKIRIEPDIDNLGTPLQIAMPDSNEGILLKDNSELKLDNSSTFLSSNNIDESGWNLLVTDSAKLTISNSAYMNVDRAATIESPNVTLSNGFLVTGYETPGEGELNIDTTTLTIDSPAPWQFAPSQVRASGDVTISSGTSISGEGGQFYFEGTASDTIDLDIGTSINEVYISGGITSLTSDLEVKKTLRIENDGELQIGPSRTLAIHDEGEIVVNGELKITGSSRGYATITSDNLSHYYSIDIVLGTLTAQLAIFEQLNTDGVTIRQDGFIDSTTALNRCIFRNSDESGGFSQLIVYNSQDLTLTQVGFEISGALQADQFNVTKANDAGSLSFENEQGNLSGEEYDDDMFDRVNWTLGNPTLSYYDTENTSLNSDEAKIQMTIILTGQPDNTEYLIQNWASSGTHTNMYLTPAGAFTNTESIAWGAYEDFGRNIGILVTATDQETYRFRVKARPVVGGLHGTALDSWDEAQPAITTLDRTAPATPGTITITENEAKRDATGKYVTLSWSAVSGADFYVPMRDEDTSGEYWPVDGFFDSFTDTNYTEGPAWAVHSGAWEAASKVLTQDGDDTGAVYFQGYNPGINYLYQLKASKINGTNGIQVPFLHRGKYPTWEIAQDVSGVHTSRVLGISTATSKVFNMNNSQWYEIKILVTGDNAYGYIDDVLMWSSNASATVTNGSYLFTGLAVENTETFFDDVALKPLIPAAITEIDDTDARDNKAPAEPSFALANVNATTFKNINISWDAITDVGSDYTYYLEALDLLGNHSTGTNSSQNVTEGFDEVIARARNYSDSPDLINNYNKGLATGTGTSADMLIAGSKPGNTFKGIIIKACDKRTIGTNCTDWLGRMACTIGDDCYGYTSAMQCVTDQCDYNTKRPGMPRWSLACIPGNNKNDNHPLGIAPTVSTHTGSPDPLDEDSLWFSFSEGSNSAGTTFAVAWHMAADAADCGASPSASGWVDGINFNPTYGYGTNATEVWTDGNSGHLDDDGVGSAGLDPGMYYCFAAKARNAEDFETALTPWSVPVQPPYKPRVSLFNIEKGQDWLGKAMLKVDGVDGVAITGDLQKVTIKVNDKSGASDVADVRIRMNYRALQDPLWQGSRGYFAWTRSGGFIERGGNSLGGNNVVALAATQCSVSESGDDLTLIFAWVALDSPWYGDQQDNGISAYAVDSLDITSDWNENQWGDVEAEKDFTFHVSNEPGAPLPFYPGADSSDYWTSNRQPALTLRGDRDPDQTANWTDSGDTVSYKTFVKDAPLCNDSANTVEESAWQDIGNATSPLEHEWTVGNQLAAGRYYWCGHSKDQHDYSVDAGVQGWVQETPEAKVRMVGIDYTAPLVSGLGAYTDDPSDSGTQIPNAPTWAFDPTLFFQWDEAQPQSTEPTSTTDRAPFKRYWYKLTEHHEGITAEELYPYPIGNETANTSADFTAGAGVGYGIKHFCVIGEDEAGNKTGWATKSALCIQIQLDLEDIDEPSVSCTPHVEQNIIYCDNTSTPNDPLVTEDAFKPTFTITDPLTYSGIYGYSFSIYDQAGHSPDKCVDNCSTWTGFEDTMEPGLPSSICESGTYRCTDSDMALEDAEEQMSFTFDMDPSNMPDLNKSVRYTIMKDGQQAAGTYYFNVLAYTIAGKWSSSSGTYRVNVCACTGNDCKDYTPSKSKDIIGTMVKFNGGEIYLGDGDGDVVNVSPFAIDSKEVSNKQYLACLADNACEPPTNDGVNSRTRTDYIFDEDYSEYPVINITWDMAQQYCQWAGKRLPSEVEWEFAAHKAVCGWDTLDLKRKWHNDLYESGDTSPVSQHHGPNMRRNQKVFNLYNNVSEWVSDWYAPREAIDYSNNPQGPESIELCMNACQSKTNSRAGEAQSRKNSELSLCYDQCYSKVIRGASFDDEFIGGAAREADSPDSYSDNLGFRCASDYDPGDANNTRKTAMQSKISPLVKSQGTETGTIRR